VMLAANYAEFALGQPSWLAMPTVTAAGANEVATLGVWGQLIDKPLPPTQTCQGWSSSSAADLALTTSSTYANSGNQICSQAQRLLCLEN
jgi:hypothetical protein